MKGTDTRCIRSRSLRMLSRTSDNRMSRLDPMAHRSCRWPLAFRLLPAFAFGVAAAPGGLSTTRHRLLVKLAVRRRIHLGEPAPIMFQFLGNFE